MATQLWEQEIDKTVDWGGDNSTGGAAVSGQYVQKFIKDTLAKKFGYLHYDRTALKYYVFADEDDYNKYANDTSGEYANLLLATFDAPAPASIAIEETSSQRMTILSSEKNQSISFKYIVKDSGSNPITESIQARFQFNNGGTIQTVIRTYDVDFDNYQTGVTQTFNIDNYLTVGTNNITVTLTGISTQATTTLTFVYTVVELGLNSTFNNKKAIEFDESKGINENYFTIPYDIKGQGEKYMEWYINGVELNQAWVNAIYPDLNALSSGYVASRNATYATNMNIYLTDDLGKLQAPFVEGKNTIQFRMYVLDTNGDRIYSTTKYYDFVLVSTQSTSDVTYILYSQDLSSGALFKPEDVISFSTQQYSSTSFKYGLYSSSGSAVTLNFNLSKTENELTTNIADLVRQITSGDEQTFEYSFLTYGKIDIVITTSLVDKEGNPLDTLHIIVDVAKAAYEVEVTKESLVLNLEALNRSNSEPNPAEWKYRNIETQFNNVLWNSASGWDGKSLVLSNGATAFIPLNVFDNYTDSGLTVEVDFTTFDVKNEDAVVLSYKDDNNTSNIIFKACEASLTDSSNEIKTNFANNYRTKIAFVLQPYSKNYTDIKENAPYANTRFIIVNGILDRWALFSGNVKWTNPTNPGILLGDPEGGSSVKFHSIRVYNKALSVNEELTNFIAESDDLLAAYERNNIYAEGTESISLDIVKNIIPTMVVYGPALTLNNVTNKSNNVELDVEFYDPENPELDFFARGAWMSCQGTSSMYYPHKNMRLYFGKTKDGKTVDDTAQYWTELYLNGEFTHGEVKDFTKLGNFHCNKKTCSDGYHKLSCAAQAEQVEKNGTQLFYKSSILDEDGNAIYYPCNYGDGSTTNEYYVDFHRPLNCDWKTVKEYRYSGVTLYKVDGYSTVQNPITGVEYQIPEFKKLKGSKKISEGEQYYIDQAQWKQSTVSGWTNRWTIKTDFAESSMTHNAGVGRLWGNAMKNVIVSNSEYDDGLACRTNAQRALGALGDPIDIRTSCDGKPIMIFQCALDDENGTIYDENGLRKYKPAEFLGQYNIMTDKGSTPLFGFEDIYDENGNKLFDASKVECWEASNNGSLFGQGVNLITDNDESNVFMGTRFVFSDYEPRWPDVEIEGPDGDDYLVAHTHNLESMWRFVNFCKDGLIYEVDGRDGYELSPYVELPESEYENYVANGKTVYKYDEEKYASTGIIEYDEFEYSSVNDLYLNAPVYYLSSTIDYDNVRKELSDKTIEGQIYKGKVASFDAKHGTYVEDIPFDDERVDTGRVDYGASIQGSEFEEDYYVNVYLIQEGSNRYKYVNEYGKTVQFTGSVDREEYEKNKDGEGYAGKTYMEYFSDKKYDYFDVWKLAAYYIYIMRFAAVDQVVKNSMLTTEDGQHYYYINYDNDTILGVRNDSTLQYHWNIDRNTYDYNANQYAYAGPKSVLWNLLELDEDFMRIVKSLDNAMYTSNVLSTKLALEMFNEKQAGTWPERSYNEQEAIKYLKTWTDSNGTQTKYLASIHGSREQHRIWFIENRFNLFDSKWGSGEYASHTIKFYSQVNGTTTNIKDIFSITASRNNVFGLTNSDLDGAIPAEWNIELDIDETFTWNTNKNWNGVSSPFSIFGVDKIKVLDFRPGVEAGNTFSDVLFDGNGSNWPSVKGTMMTKLLYGISDDFRTSSVTYRYTNYTESDVTYKVNGEDKVLKPGEYYDSLEMINISGASMNILGPTVCTAKGLGGLNSLTALEELDIRNVFNTAALLGELNISGLTNLHVFRAVGSSITSFVPAEGVILYEVSLPQLNVETGHQGISTITLKNVTFKKASEDQEAPLLKYTPDSALRNVSFNNVTGIDIQQFISDWDIALEENKAHNVCTLNLENISMTDVTPEWLLNTITKFNLSTFTGKIELLGSGENGALTEDEYNALVEQYGINVFNTTSSLVFNAKEGVFWTLTAKQVSSETTEKPNGIDGATTIWYEGIHELEYTVKATVFPIDPNNDIHYEVSYYRQDPQTKNWSWISCGYNENTHISGTSNNVQVTCETDINTSTAKFKSSIVKNNTINEGLNVDRLYRIDVINNGKTLNVVYLNVSKVNLPKAEDINIVLNDEVINESLNLIKSEPHLFKLQYVEDVTSNVEIKNLSVTCVLNKIDDNHSASISIQNVIVGKTIDECSFELIPTIPMESHQTSIDVKIEYNIQVDNIISKTLSTTVVVIPAIGFELWEADENLNKIKICNVCDEENHLNKIEINEIQNKYFVIKPYSSIAEDGTVDYFYNKEFSELTFSQDPGWTPQTTVEKLSDENPLAFVILMKDNNMKSFDDEFMLSLTITPSETNDSVKELSNIYHINSSIIYPDKVRLMWPSNMIFGSFNEDGSEKYVVDESSWTDITLNGITLLSGKNAINKEDDPIDVPLLIDVYGESVNDPVNYPYEITECNIIITESNNGLETVSNDNFNLIYDSENKRYVINFKPGVITGQYSKALVNVKLSVDYNVNGTKYQTPLDCTFEVMRSLAGASYIEEVTSSGLYLFDTKGNLYDVLTEDRKEVNTEFVQNIKLYGVIDDIIGIAFINEELGKDNEGNSKGWPHYLSPNYVAIPFRGCSDIESYVQYLWPDSYNYGNNSIHTTEKLFQNLNYYPDDTDDTKKVKSLWYALGNKTSDGNQVKKPEIGLLLRSKIGIYGDESEMFMDPSYGLDNVYPFLSGSLISEALCGEFPEEFTRYLINSYDLSVPEGVNVGGQIIKLAIPRAYYHFTNYPYNVEGEEIKSNLHGFVGSVSEYVQLYNYVISQESTYFAKIQTICDILEVSIEDTLIQNIIDVFDNISNNKQCPLEGFLDIKNVLLTLTPAYKVNICDGGILNQLLCTSLRIDINGTLTTDLYITHKTGGVNDYVNSAFQHNPIYMIPLIKLNHKS